MLCAIIDHGCDSNDGRSSEGVSCLKEVLLWLGWKGDTIGSFYITEISKLMFRALAFPKGLLWKLLRGKSI